jgi:hypothetical protein
MALKRTADSAPRRKKARTCPECGSAETIPIVHGIPTAALQKLIDEDNAIIADREEWEGMSEWYCKACGCDWSGQWRRFKIPSGVNATRVKK